MRDAFKVAVVVGWAVASLPAIAQNRDGEPYVGTLTLNTGYTPDPQVINVEAGGELAATNAAGHCAGFISDRPDLRLQFTAGSRPLILSVAATTDTTLVVNAPDGSWHCDDDGGVNGSNPAVRFDSPQSGRYEIWVGTYSSGATQRAQLQVSEVNSQ